MSAFLGIYTALYDYTAQNDEELSLQEGDLLYVLEKSDVDDWWKVKKRVVDADVEEPVGLVPCTYIEPATVASSATALYDYDKQTEEELSFAEGDVFDVYDTSDPNWALVGKDGQFGFVPGNYIEVGAADASAGAAGAAGVAVGAGTATTASSAVNANGYGATSAAAVAAAPVLPTSSFLPPPTHISKQKAISHQKEEEQQQQDSFGSESDEEDAPPMPTRPGTSNSALPPSPTPALNNYDGGDDDVSTDEDAPPMPARPGASSAKEGSSNVGNTGNGSRSRQSGSVAGLLPSSNKDEDYYNDDFFVWPTYEIDGKKKRKAKLEIGDGQIFITPEGSSTPRSWTIQDLAQYDNEKKHVFLDFNNPIASYELHAGTNDAAEAIISVLADMKGMASMRALDDIKAASTPSNRPQGRILYDFEAASPDELNCYEGDLVYIVNDKKSREWWMVENVGTGKKGVVPSNYIKTISGRGKAVEEAEEENAKKDHYFKKMWKKSSSQLSLTPKKKNRSRSSTRSSNKDDISRARELEDIARTKEELNQQKRAQERREKQLRTLEERDRLRRADEASREKRLKKSSSGDGDLSKPNPHRVRTWIDRSGSFKVEAEFLGVQDGKVHLHKVNGVKIAVAAQKLSTEDLEYVERITGTSLDKYKSSKHRKQQPKHEDSTAAAAPPQSPSSAIPFSEKNYEYWFEFFLGSGVDANIVDRYAKTFAKEQMDESVLEDITPQLLRSLGLREGDILKVKRALDKRFGRDAQKDSTDAAANDGSSNGGLFSGANGALKNNKEGSPEKFEDDAWAAKPASAAALSPPPAVKPQLTGSIQDLVDIKPMEPTKTASQQPLPIKPVTATNDPKSAPAISKSSNDLIDSLFASQQKTGGAMGAQLTGATLFGQPTGAMMPMPTGFMPIGMMPMLTGQATGLNMFGQPTGGLMPLQATGGIPQTTFGVPQLTGGAPMILPLNTGAGASMPATTFGGANVVQLQPTGVTLQKTGGAIPAMQPNMRTGGMMPTGGIMPTGNMPMTSFGGQATGGIMPMTSFGGQATGGVMPATSFGAQATGGMIPATSFGQPMQQPIQTVATGGLPQTSFGMPQLTGMMANTGLAQQPLAQQPLAQQPLAQQPTGAGFGNAPLQAQATGHANLAKATPDNPFGF